MQKDYWNISKRDFRMMGVIFILASLIVGLGLFNTSIPSNQKMLVTITFIVCILFVVLFFWLAALFRKHSSKAITISYVYLIASLVYFLFTDFILKSFSDFTNGIIINLLRYLIFIYLLVNVYKASKQKTLA